jgi:hypothetical protein
MTTFWCIAVLAFCGLAACAVGADVSAREDFGPGWAARWRPHAPARWTVAREEGRNVLRMTEPGVPPKEIRRPGEFAIWSGHAWGDVEFTAEVRCDQEEANTARDAILLLGYQDDTHFYYVHLAGRSDSVHNAILLVNGKDRARIDPFDLARPNPVILSDRRFHRIRVVRRVESGEILVYADGRKEPVMRAVDRTLTWGRLGVGSFDDTASFHSLHAVGKAVAERGTDARP